MWHVIGFAAAAIFFFFFLYQDTSKLNRMELQAERLERTLPHGQRVIAVIPPFAGSEIYIHHMIDRACIGHCFSFGNYEPSSGQFRLRAAPGNPIATSDYKTSNEMDAGRYVVRPEDLPISEIYLCSPGGDDICMRALRAGEEAGTPVVARYP